MTTRALNKPGIVDSTAIIGAKVENPQGENLGKIESLMLDLNEGRILYAVLSFGGFLGMGDKLFPVPVDQLMFSTDDHGKIRKCIFEVAKDRLKNAPGFDRNSLPNWSDRAYAGKVYTYYGSSPYWDE